MKIYKPYEKEKPPRRAQHPGNRFEKQYAERYTETGHPYLVEVGEHDNYESIQSYKDECDINLILQRYAAGDTSMMRPDAQYIDTSELPSSYHEMYNLIKAQEEKFNALPAAIKQKFENNFRVWASMAGTGEWLERMGMQGPAKAEEKKKEEVKKDNGEPQQ